MYTKAIVIVRQFYNNNQLNLFHIGAGHAGALLIAQYLKSKWLFRAAPGSTPKFYYIHLQDRLQSCMYYYLLIMQLLYVMGPMIELLAPAGESFRASAHFKQV